MTIIDEYLASVAEPQRKELERVRKIIQKTAPNTEEVITYGMPGYKYKGKYLIAFANFKDHMSLFPGSKSIEVYKKELSSFKTSKGTIQFTDKNILPEKLIEDIVMHRVNEIDK